ncbi:MAG TPA: hypothetical protein VGN42_03430, partial [Pirellulales bacterium]|nr:hypothetical protein [Pirellulales bacterium]
MNEFPAHSTPSDAAGQPAFSEPPRSWLRRTAPQALVFAALAAVAYWGHQSGWSMSAIASLSGHAAP